jgi:hypothetical protein
MFNSLGDEYRNLQRDWESEQNWDGDENDRRPRWGEQHDESDSAKEAHRLSESASIIQNEIARREEIGKVRRRNDAEREAYRVAAGL